MIGNKTRAIIFALLLGSPPSAKAQTVYSPEQAFGALYQGVYDQIMGHVSEPGIYWFSMTLAGSEVTPGDTRKINDLANFIPPATPFLQGFDRVPRLADVYEKIIYSRIVPQRPFAPEYEEAKLYLAPDGQASLPYTKYLECEALYRSAEAKSRLAESKADRDAALQDMLSLEEKWGVFGYRAEVIKQLNIIAKEQYVQGDIRIKRQRDVLTLYRQAARQAIGAQSGAFVSPLSQFSPAPDQWSGESGWLTVSFADEMINKLYEKHTSSKRGGGGLSLGFVTIGGGGGGSTTTESRVKQVSKLSYEFQVKRVSIQRDWLDGSVFFHPEGWTWEKNDNTNAFPYVAVRLKDGNPQESADNKYDNTTVGLALLPVEAIVARKVKLVSTVRKEDYDKIDKAGSAGGGGSFFGLFGGAKKNWSSQRISEDEHTVTFSVEMTGPTVIGFVSEVVPLCPNPNLDSKWPGKAWLPK